MENLEELIKAIIAEEKPISFVAAIKRRTLFDSIKPKEDSTMMELKDTAGLMQSTNYKERFCAEYFQTVIRFRKLKEMLEKWDEGELEFEPACVRGLYNLQERAMADYIAVLEARAQIEQIDINE